MSARQRKRFRFLACLSTALSCADVGRVSASVLVPSAPIVAEPCPSESTTPSPSVAATTTASEPPAASPSLSSPVPIPPPTHAATSSEARNWILTGFYAHHFSALDKQLNDNSSGIFFEHDYNPRYGLLVGEFKNSGNITSHLAAGTWQPLRAGFISFGLIAGFIDGYIQLRDGKLSPAILPFAEMTTRRFKANIFCVPPILKTAAPVCAIQFGVNIGR